MERLSHTYGDVAVPVAPLEVDLCPHGHAALAHPIGLAGLAIEQVLPQDLPGAYPAELRPHLALLLADPDPRRRAEGGQEARGPVCARPILKVTMTLTDWLTLY